MKNSFVLYTSYNDQIKLLNMEQRGLLLTAIIQFASGCELPEMDGMTQMAFAFIRSDMERDAEKYRQTCEARKEAGKSGGRPKAKKANGFSEKAKKANGFSEKQSKAKKPDNEYEDEDDDDYDSERVVSAPAYPYKDVIDYLNQKAGTQFKDKSKDSRRHIKARFDEGFTMDDFKKVIDGRVKAWKGDPKMCEYLRPSTLFGSKFEAYLNAKPGSANKFANFTQRTYNFDDLERKLTGVIG